MHVTHQARWSPTQQSKKHQCTTLPAVRVKNTLSAHKETNLRSRGGHSAENQAVINLHDFTGKIGQTHKKSCEKEHTSVKLTAVSVDTQKVVRERTRVTLTGVSDWASKKEKNFSHNQGWKQCTRRWAMISVLGSLLHRNIQPWRDPESWKMAEHCTTGWPWILGSALHYTKKLRQGPCRGMENRK